ncbi:MAG TPA: hypothetical protein VGH27_13990 [Streptosporangiaceae bacterium]
MLKRIPVSGIQLSAALAGVALTGALCACGSAGHSGAVAGVGSGTTVSPSATGSVKASPTRTSSPTPTSPSAHASSPPVIGGGPIIFAVRLGGGFQPNTLRISPGQQFVVTVDSSVKANGPGLPSSCSGISAPVDNGMLTVTCASGSFTYTAQRAGTAELTATVRPNCSRGGMCPQWIAEATLKITIL